MIRPAGRALGGITIGSFALSGSSAGCWIVEGEIDGKEVTRGVVVGTDARCLGTNTVARGTRAFV